MSSSTPKGRHKRRLAILVLVSMLNTFCATIDRGQSRGTVSFNGETGANVD